MLAPLPITDIADVQMEALIALSEGIWNDADGKLHFCLAAGKVHTSHPLPTNTTCEQCKVLARCRTVMRTTERLIVDRRT